MPARSSPRSIPPIPANKLPNVIGIIWYTQGMAPKTVGITKEIVESRLGAGESLRSIARSFGVSHQAICARRDIWGAPRLRLSRINRPPSQGQFVDAFGYIMQRTSNKAGAKAYTPEHVIVAERKLGRKLERGEVVHHVNGINSDNRPENLYVCYRATHSALHDQLEKIALDLVRAGEIVFDGVAYRRR